MQKWDYCFVTYYTTTNIVANVNGQFTDGEMHYLIVVDHLGEERWELVSAVSPEEQTIVLVFKRPTATPAQS